MAELSYIYEVRIWIPRDKRNPQDPAETPDYIVVHRGVDYEEARAAFQENKADRARIRERELAKVRETIKSVQARVSRTFEPRAKDRFLSQLDELRDAEAALLSPPKGLELAHIQVVNSVEDIAPGRVFMPASIFCDALGLDHRRVIKVEAGDVVYETRECDSEVMPGEVQDLPWHTDRCSLADFLQWAGRYTG